MCYGGVKHVLRPFFISAVGIGCEFGVLCGDFLPVSLEVVSYQYAVGDYVFFKLGYGLGYGGVRRCAERLKQVALYAAVGVLAALSCVGFF